MAETFPNLGREIDIQIQETQTTQLGLHWDIINSQKLKAKIIFKTAREKIEVTYKGIPIKISEEFSTETFQARRKWDNVFKILKGQRWGKDPVIYVYWKRMGGSKRNSFLLKPSSFAGREWRKLVASVLRNGQEIIRTLEGCLWGPRCMGMWQARSRGGLGGSMVRWRKWIVEVIQVWKWARGCGRRSRGRREAKCQRNAEHCIPKQTHGLTEVS